MIATLRKRESETSGGQALVETAIVLPILLLLGLVTFDVGRAIYAHIALTEATQEGALYGAYEPGGNIAQRVKTSSDHAWVTGASVSVSCTPPVDPDLPPPGTVVVTSSYPLPVISPPAELIFGGTFTLSVTITATNFEGSC
jgi:Flp pilus assembly protein TadG